MHGDEGWAGMRKVFAMPVQIFNAKDWARIQAQFKGPDLRWLRGVKSRNLKIGQKKSAKPNGGRPVCHKALNVKCFVVEV
jgi:hypothetical protein